MNLTNNFNLPKSIVNAVANDPYDNKGTLSVTTLLKPPYMVALEQKHRDDITEDVSDRIYSLLGQSVHHILERAGSDEDLVEERFFHTVNGHKVSGQLDLLEANGTLNDFKVTSVWAIMAAMEEGKSEWEAQLNMLAWLARLHGHEVSKLRIVAIARDWSPSKAQITAGYPRRVEAIEFPLWSDEEQEAYIQQRVDLHTADRKAACSESDRWAKPTRYAIMEKGKKRAKRVLDSVSEAQEYMTEHQLDPNTHSIETRHGENVRCQGYCSVAPFCPKYAALCGSVKRDLRGQASS